MITDTYVTLIKMKKENRVNAYYVYGTYPAHFEETKGINVNVSSRDRGDVDAVTVYIPEVLNAIDVEDIIIRNPNQGAIKEMKSLREYQEHYDAYMVTSSDVFDFGSLSMRHTVVRGK